MEGSPPECAFDDGAFCELGSATAQEEAGWAMRAGRGWGGIGWAELSYQGRAISKVYCLLGKMAKVGGRGRAGSSRGTAR